ncbi:hypothetical protein GCM10010363_70170 [Streptomyces omiyaensis]|nr:hypothetical protein GCM10010363_70170 [Streptomyces omiyaensis]
MTFNHALSLQDPFDKPWRHEAGHPRGPQGSVAEDGLYADGLGASRRMGHSGTVGDPPAGWR